MENRIGRLLRQLQALKIELLALYERGAQGDELLSISRKLDQLIAEIMRLQEKGGASDE